MKLSILIPMYNAENYIGNCIECLIHQDLHQDDYEIIILDDGSTDTSVSIVTSYQKHYKNINLHLEPNVGAYSSRNKLLKLAKGNYIYNLDADDYLVHNCLGKLLALSEKHNLDVIGFDTVETMSIDSHNLNKAITENDLIVTPGVEFIENHLYFRQEIWWYFIKRSLLQDLNLSFTNNEYNADVLFTSKILLNAERVGYIPYEIHRYVQTQDSLMRSNDFKILSKRLNYLHQMIVNQSRLINNIEIDRPVVINNMAHRRDVFTFFNIMNMIRNPYAKLYVKDKVKGLKNEGAYPIRNFNTGNYNTSLYRILRYIVNKESLIYSIISIKNLFVKPKLQAETTT